MISDHPFSISYKLIFTIFYILIGIHFNNTFADDFDEQMRRARLSELENPTLNLENSTVKKPVSLTIEQAVKYVIQNNVSVYELKPGIYFLKIRSGKKSAVKRFVKN